MRLIHDTDCRTLSIHITDSLAHAEVRTKRDTARELSELDWHKVSTTDVLQRLNVSPKSGLDAEQVKRRVAQYGLNQMSPPPRNLVKKWFFYVFGGFGSVLFIGAVLCFVAWKPLGLPNPQASNLALAVILIVVIVIQTAFVSDKTYTADERMRTRTGLQVASWRPLPTCYPRT